RVVVFQDSGAAIRKLEGTDDRTGAELVENESGQWPVGDPPEFPGAFLWTRGGVKERLGSATIQRSHLTAAGPDVFEKRGKFFRGSFRHGGVPFCASRRTTVAALASVVYPSALARARWRIVSRADAGSWQNVITF